MNSSQEDCTVDEGEVLTENSTETGGEAASESEVFKLQQETNELRGNYLRALADLENYRKRAIKERSDLLKYQGERVFVDMLDVLDNLELAIEHSESNPDQLREGVKLIHKMMVDIFDRWEVKAEAALGKPFDPSRHNAITQMAAEGKEAGTVLNELKRAYFYKDKLLRPAEVVVVAKPE
jgi:molecular chaperone GrpE